MGEQVERKIGLGENCCCQIGLLDSLMQDKWQSGQICLTKHTVSQMSLIGTDVILYCETLGFENRPGLLSDICIDFICIYFVHIFRKIWGGKFVWPQAFLFPQAAYLIWSDLNWAKHKYSQRVFTLRLLQETCILSVLNIKIYQLYIISSDRSSYSDSGLL